MAFDQKTDNPSAIAALLLAKREEERKKEDVAEAAEIALGDAEALKVGAHPRKYAFLVAYAKTHNITDACRCAGIPRQSHYDWMEDDPHYPPAFKIAKEIACDSIAREAYKRAVEGWEEPVYQGGMLVGTIIRKSDRLLEVLLKGSDPDTYQRKSVEVTGNVTHNHTGEVSYQVEAWHLGLEGRDLLDAMKLQMQNNKLGIPTEPKPMVLLPSTQKEKE